MERKLSEKDINKMTKYMREAKCCILETNNGTTLFGNAADLLALYADLSHELFKNAHLDKKLILEACKLGLDMDSMYNKTKDLEKMDKELDKKLETIEKLVDILKDLRKGDK